MTNKDAVPTQTIAEQAETLQRVYDLVGMGALARTPGILLTNLENMKRRSDCLSGIEQLFTYEVPDDDMPDEMIDECDLNWGQCRAEYVETFKAALPAFIARHPEYAPTAEQAESAPKLSTETVDNLVEKMSADLLAARSGDDAAQALVYPAEFTDDLQWILGLISGADYLAQWKDYADQLRDMLAASPAAPAQSGEPVRVTPAEYETAVATLRHVIECLRTTGSYTDEEGEATDYLEPLLSAAPQPSQPVEAGETCKCRRLGDWKGFHHPLCDQAPTQSAVVLDGDRAAWKSIPKTPPVEVMEWYGDQFSAPVLLHDGEKVLDVVARWSFVDDGWVGSHFSDGPSPSDYEHLNAKPMRWLLLSEIARAASPQATATQTRTHTTQPGESVMGIALRECGNEAGWRHILACNPKFADMLPHEYFPVGTVLTLPPAAAQPASGGDGA